MHAPRSRSRVRCTSIIRARNSWIGGRALPSHKSRAGNDRRDERGSTGCDAFARSISPGVASTGAAHAVPGAFEICVLEMGGFRNAPLGGGSTIRVDDDGGRAGMRAGRCERQSPQQSRGHHAACIDRGRPRVSRQRRHGASRAASAKFRARWRWVVEPTLYTVEGRQAGDLRQKCGSALICKAKPPARSCGKSSLFAGTADKAH